MATPAPRWYLGLCAIFQNEARWLAEWIEFYRLVGVEHFWLYNDRSTDNFAEVLRPYVRDGVVELIDRNLDPTGAEPHRVLTRMVETFSDGVRRARGQVRWLVCVDTDEFLFSPAELSLRTFLQTRFDSKPNVGAVCANWLMFGTSGVKRVPPNRLLIEVLTRRAPESIAANLHVKSVLRPDCVVRMREQHGPVLAPPYVQVDSRGRPFTGPWTSAVDVSLLRVHHYYVRDEDWVATKVARRKRLFGASNPQALKHPFETFNAVADDTILRYVPALRRALGKAPSS